jgi:thiamine-phosphate pyrophosphorylase
MFDPSILRLVAITDDAIDHRANVVQRATAAVRGGATCVQLRLKHATPHEVVDVARALVSAVGVPVIVNDRADIALAAGAAGVHVGDADLPVVAIRRFVPPHFVIGASLGSERELENARDADYVGIGPVFASGSKNDAGDATGIEGFKRLAALCNLPAVAIGGITAESAPQIMAAGAAGVAAINAIFRGADPEAAARLMAAAIGR